MKIMIVSMEFGKPTNITLEKKSNQSLQNLNLGNFTNIFIIQNQILGPILNGNQLNNNLMYSLIEPIGDIYD